MISNTEFHWYLIFYCQILTKNYFEHGHCLPPKIKRNDFYGQVLQSAVAIILFICLGISGFFCVQIAHCIDPGEIWHRF